MAVRSEEQDIESIEQLAAQLESKLELEDSEGSNKAKGVNENLIANHFNTAHNKGAETVDEPEDVNSLGKVELDSLKILIVDDSAAIRAILKKTISEEYPCIVASDGEEAWTLLQQDPDIGLVVSDLEMPNLDGHGLLERVRSSDIPRIRDLVVLVVTGTEDSEVKRKVLDAGANDFLRKYEDPAELLARIHIYKELALAKQLLAAQETALDDSLVRFGKTDETDAEEEPTEKGKAKKARTRKRRGRKKTATKPVLVKSDSGPVEPVEAPEPEASELESEPSAVAEDAPKETTQTVVKDDADVSFGDVWKSLKLASKGSAHELRGGLGSKYQSTHQELGKWFGKTGEWMDGVLPAPIKNVNKGVLITGVATALLVIIAIVISVTGTDSETPAPVSVAGQTLPADSKTVQSSKKLTPETPVLLARPETPPVGSHMMTAESARPTPAKTESVDKTPEQGLAEQAVEAAESSVEAKNKEAVTTEPKAAPTPSRPVVAAKPAAPKAPVIAPTPAKPVSPPPVRAKARVSPNVSKAELNKFIKRFSFVYEAGDYEQFMNLFARDARTNDRTSRKGIGKDYKELFQTTDLRQMKIGEVSWDLEGKEARGWGNFEVGIQKTGEDKVENYSGSLTFHVRKSKAGKIRIKRLYHGQRRVK